jgi:uncharacterized protein YyaL (SSP411 family)
MPHTNNLINTSSPYLLQHAHNPVDWYEWGDEAFAKAKAEDKLVLVSIGYAACHWCHVMERECFEKEDTAAIMNEHFICIKVDREERPDIDQIYMNAVQLLTGHGGWPLNCFTLPDGRPLHGGTYFPKQDWERVLKSLSDFYRNKKQEALEFATDLTNGIKRSDTFIDTENSRILSKETILDLVHKWQTNFDTLFGGYTWAPKFPMPNNWEYYLQLGIITKNSHLTAASHLTLQRMAEGGIYDQIGGGFARYSTDSFWKVPHFEKMLYDNAQLLGLYALAFRHKANPLYKQVVSQTHQFIQQELTNAEGLFYSSLDADSEGVEGKFYVWSKQELVDLLGEDEPLFSLYYSIDAYGNWEHGINILYKTRTDTELVNLTGKSVREILEVIHRCNEILVEARDKRIAPGLDDKCITSWNALMIKGYAEAYETFGNNDYLNAATRAADVLLEKLWDGEKLYRIYKNGKVSIHGFAEDYALFIEALIALYEAGSNEHYLLTAQKILQSAIRQFYSEEHGLFHFTSIDDEQLITRKMDTHDDVIPSSNSVFAKVLLKLGYYFDKPEFHDIVNRMILIVQPNLQKQISGYTNWLQAINWLHYGFRQVIICGENAIVGKNRLHQVYIPNGIIIALNKPTPAIPLLADKQPGKEITIYVCTDKTCSLPQQKIPAVLSLLGLDPDAVTNAPF